MNTSNISGMSLCGKATANQALGCSHIRIFIMSNTVNHVNVLKIFHMFVVPLIPQLTSDVLSVWQPFGIWKIPLSLIIM